MATLNHPWQHGPSELISHAIEHMHEGSDFDRRIAFLLLDIGVETSLKTFLTLPDTVTHTTIKFQERKSAAEGGFHAVLEGLKKAAQPKKLLGINLDEVEFYHTKRNTLYHDGNGITVSAELVEKYASLSVGLLKNLLDIDLSDELNLPKLLAKAKEIENKQYLEMKNKLQKINDAANALFENHTLLVAERLAPKTTLPTFRKSLQNIENKYLEGDTFIDENGAEISFYNIKQPDKYFLDIINFTKSAIENNYLHEKLFAEDIKSKFIKNLEVLLALHGFLSYEDLVLSLVQDGTEEQISWSRDGWITPLDYLLSNAGFEDNESRYKSFSLGFDKTMLEIQQTKERIEQWLNKAS